MQERHPGLKQIINNSVILHKKNDIKKIKPQMVFFMTIYVSNNSLAFLLFTGQVVSLLKLQSERRDCGNVLTSSPCAEPPLRSPPPLAPASLSSRSARSWPPGSRSRVAPAGGGSCAAWSPPSASTAEEWTPHLK